MTAKQYFRNRMFKQLDESAKLNERAEIAKIQAATVCEMCEKREATRTLDGWRWCDECYNAV